MASDFDIGCVKGNSIPHVDALTRLRFYPIYPTPLLGQDMTQGQSF